MTDIRTFLRTGEPLLFDGAMGTHFAALPGRAGERCELGSLRRPEEIAAIHRAYLEAGCRRNYYEHPREDAILMTLEFENGTESDDAGRVGESI